MTRLSSRQFIDCLIRPAVAQGPICRSRTIRSDGWPIANAALGLVLGFLAEA